MEDIQEQKDSKKRVKKDLNYYHEHDMKYRGPLNILNMRVIGWVLMAITACAIGFSMFIKAKKITNLDVLENILSIIGSLSLSAFMVASFSYILQNRTNAGKVLRTYALGAIGIAAAYYLLYFVYGSSILAHFQKKGYWQAVQTLDSFFTSILGKGLNFNVFIDLVMFALFSFFLFYKPRTKFFKKNILLFRWCSVLPIIYVCAMFIWKSLFSFDLAHLPLWAYALLPSKSPMMIFSFCTVAVLVKLRERKFLKGGKTEEEYEKVFNSNGNSWIVAKDFAISLAIFGIVDLIISILLASIYVYIYQQAQGCLDADGNIIEGMEQAYETFVYQSNNVYLFMNSSKIGTAAGQIFFAPFVLLFSFNRKHYKSQWDILLPLIGIGAMVFVIFNWIFAIIVTL